GAGPRHPRRLPAADPAGPAVPERNGHRAGRGRLPPPGTAAGPDRLRPARGRGPPLLSGVLALPGSGDATAGAHGLPDEPAQPLVRPGAAASPAISVYVHGAGERRPQAVPLPVEPLAGDGAQRLPAALPEGTAARRPDGEPGPGGGGVRGAAADRHRRL